MSQSRCTKCVAIFLSLVLPGSPVVSSLWAQTPGAPSVSAPRSGTQALGTGAPGAPFPSSREAFPLPAAPPGREEMSLLQSLSIVQPANGSLITTATPQIVIVFSDPSRGIDPSTLQVFVNGVDKTHLFTMSESGATSRMTEQDKLLDGQNTVVASIRNRAGHQATAASSFIVDTKAQTVGRGGARSPIEILYLLPPQRASFLSRDVFAPEPPRVSRDLVQFGYDQFTSPISTFAPVTGVPVGPDYVLGPGDILVVYLWGLVENYLTLPIDQNGTIFLPKVGVVPVWGLTLPTAQALVRNQLSRYFSSFQMEMTLGALRTMQVYVVGEVARPGTYTISALATVSNAIFSSGGPTKLGSLRSIRLLRNGTLVGEVDLYDFLLRGERGKDYRLQAGDVVFVPPVGPVAAITGEVKRPGIYELRGSTRLWDLVGMAGGVLPGGNLGRVQVERIEVAERRIMDLDLSRASVNGESLDNVELRDGDLTRVFPLDSRLYNVVFLEGFVRHPGEYALKPGMHLSNILSAGEVLPEAYLDRVEVLRIKPDLTQEVLVANLREVWQGRRDQDLELTRLDRIVITSEVQGSLFVHLSGEVKRPGRYPVVRGERLSSILERAGGFTDKAYLRGAVFTRDAVRRVEQQRLEQFIKAQEQRLIAESSAIAASGQEASAEQVALTQRRELLRVLASQVTLGRVVIKLNDLSTFTGSADDISLESGDSLHIPPPPSSVLILGSVRNPTAVLYKPGETFEYYLQRAGGLTPDAAKEEVHIIRADGSASTSFLKVREVEQGDTIVAPPSVEAKYRPLPFWRDIVTIFGQFVLGIAGVAAIIK